MARGPQRTDKPAASPGSEDANKPEAQQNGEAAEGVVEQQLASAASDSHPDSALGQRDPVAPRAERSGRVKTAVQPPVEEMPQMNPNKDNPTDFSNAPKQPEPESIYLPNQTLIPPEEGGEDPRYVANNPYGSEPRSVDPKTGLLVKPPLPPEDEGTR